MFCCVSMKEYCGIITGVNIEYNTYFLREKLAQDYPIMYQALDSLIFSSVQK